jgi:hypothetical protein
VQLIEVFQIVIDNNWLGTGKEEKIEIQTRVVQMEIIESTPALSIKGRLDVFKVLIVYLNKLAN